MDQRLKSKVLFNPAAENMTSAAELLSGYTRREVSPHVTVSPLCGRPEGRPGVLPGQQAGAGWGVLCIGSDRITGDCLGPLVGSRLLSSPADLPVYGTLQHPLHAENLQRILPTIKERHPGCRFIAVDAALGSKEHLGKVSISPGPLLPGRGLRKSLPAIGDVSITGIVGMENGIPELTLPYTRLYLVDRLAEFISQCIVKCLGI